MLSVTAKMAVPQEIIFLVESPSWLFRKGGIPHNNSPRNMWNGHLGCSEKVAGKPVAKYAD
ncbi:hypothetical protein [Microcoleus sp. Pol12A5]|uniref:hypothetical protein n=1 Tax=Microcoleus sp. Pol12A5 TaxID=3055392 RepID=UPI002FD62413